MSDRDLKKFTAASMTVSTCFYQDIKNQTLMTGDSIDFTYFQCKMGLSDREGKFIRLLPQYVVTVVLSGKCTSFREF